MNKKTSTEKRTPGSLHPACYTAGQRVNIHKPKTYSGQSGIVIEREEGLRQVMVRLDGSNREAVFHMTEIQAV